MNDTNDPPTQIELVGSGSVPENSGGGTLVGYVQIVDEDVADKHTTSIVAVYRESDNRAVYGLFHLNSSSRALTLMSGARLDYENARQYVIKIVTVDSGSPALSLTESLTVNITDLNEKPSNVTLDNEKVRTELNHINLHKAIRSFNKRSTKIVLTVPSSPRLPFLILTTRTKIGRRTRAFS